MAALPWLPARYQNPSQVDAGTSFRHQRCKTMDVQREIRSDTAMRQQSRTERARTAADEDTVGTLSNLHSRRAPARSSVVTVQDLDDPGDRLAGTNSEHGQVPNLQAKTLLRGGEKGAGVVRRGCIETGVPQFSRGRLVGPPRRRRRRGPARFITIAPRPIQMEWLLISVVLGHDVVGGIEHCHGRVGSVRPIDHVRVHDG